jgi:hypothetical protein
MAVLAAAAPYIGLATTAVGAYNQIEGGKAAKANAEAVAIQQEREGKAAQAEAQREALNERKKANYAASRALAVSAASGAGADYNAVADLKAEGDYRVLSALYSGDTDANLAKFAAGATRRTGAARQRGAYMSAASTILGGASGFYGKYGDGGSVSHYDGASSRYDGIGDYNVTGQTYGQA